jgi:CO/xanthine dehydrogenase Mo-binding subunit
VKELSDFAVVNHSVPRGDGIAKVTGGAVYTSDMVLEHMAWAKVLRSPFARARILSIDVSAALSHPGVVDAELKRLDPLTDLREREYAFFSEESFPRLLAAHGVAL